MPKAIDLLTRDLVQVYDDTTLNISYPYRGGFVRFLVNATDFFNMITLNLTLRLRKTKKTLYLSLRHPDHPGYEIYLHRWLCPEIDDDPDLHIHHGGLDSLDSRRSMLRPMTAQDHSKLHWQLRAEAKIAKEGSKRCNRGA